MRAGAELERFAAFCERHLRLEDGRPFVLEEFQKTMLGDFFAGATETLILIGKKNGKTSLLAALALWHLTTVRDAQCVIAATARDQAARMADQAAGFIRRSAGLGARMRVTQRVISSLVDGGRITVLAADTDTTDGLLPPTLALVDELHRAKSAELHGLLRDSLGPRHGRMIVISTAGDDETTPLGRMRLEAYRLPHVHRDGAYRCARSANAMFAMHEWALDAEDDLDDLELVKQANPASWQTVEALRERHASPSMESWQWARFACGVWLQGEDAAISPVEWAAAAAPGAVIPAGETIAVGVDLGWKWDTTAIVPLWHTPEQKWRFGAPSILVPPRDGTSLPVDRVFGAVEAMCDRWDVTRLVLDPSADGEHLAQRVESELGVEVVAHSQRPEPMSLAAQRFAAELRSGRMEHPAHPDFTAHVLSAAPKAAPSGSWRFVKRRRPIDALIAAAMVLSVEMDSGTSTSIYEERGLLVLTLDDESEAWPSAGMLIGDREEG